MSTRKPLGAAYWQELAGTAVKPFGQPFRGILACPDDDAPLDWMEQSAQFVCPHCSRAFKPGDNGLLSLLPSADPYQLSPSQRAALNDSAPLAESPISDFASLWKHVEHQCGDLTDKLVLDAGAGSGWAARWFASKGANVAALDVNVSQSGLGGISEDRIDCIEADLCRLPFSPESVDIVFASRVIAWQRRPERFAKEVGRVLKPDGLFLSFLEPYGQLPVELQTTRGRLQMTQADYAGIFREGGMSTECRFAADRSELKQGWFGNLMRPFLEQSSREVRLLVGKITPDIQLPEIRWRRGRGVQNGAR